MLNRFKYYYGKQSVQFKLLVFMIIIVFFVVLFLTIPYMTIYKKSVEENINNQAMQINRQLKNSAEVYFESVEMMTRNLNKNDDINQFLERSWQYRGNSYDIDQAIKEELYDFKDVNKDVIGLAIVNSHGDLLSNDMVRMGTANLSEDFWYQKSISNAEKIHINTKLIGTNIRSIYDYYSSDVVVSFSKALVDNSGNIRGATLVDIKLGTIENIFENVGFGEDDFFYIVNRNGEVVYAPLNETVYRVNTDWIVGKSGKSVKSIKGINYQINYEYSSYLDSYIVSVFSLEESQRTINVMMAVSVIVSTFMILIASFFGYLATNNIKQRLDLLKSMMSTAQKGELQDRFIPMYDDEIDELGETFNQMIKSIGSLVKQIEQDQKILRKSELKSFQMQIKPHFLYNTLDTINWMAQEYDAEDISNMVLALTTFFRLSLNNGKEIISLGEELEQIKSYMEIQKIRYEKRFDFSIDCSDDLLNYRVIKLILQPIIENSIYHGIKPKKKKGSIIVKAQQIDDKIVFFITDDGIGIDNDTLNDINKNLRNGKSKDTDKYGIGIYNVNERIRLTFGNEYGLSIKRNDVQGITVKIVIPVIEK